MALTNESFRDPRKLYKLRVKSPFYISGREKPAEVGEVVSLPRSQAAEVIHSNKAIWHDDEPTAASTSPILRAQPPNMPDAKAAVDTKASKTTKGDQTT